MGVEVREDRQCAIVFPAEMGAEKDPGIGKHDANLAVEGETRPRISEVARRHLASKYRESRSARHECRRITTERSGLDDLVEANFPHEIEKQPLASRLAVERQGVSPATAQRIA